MGLIRNIIDTIQANFIKQKMLINGSKIERLGKPLQEMTIEEKNNYVLHLYSELIPEKTDPNIFYLGVEDISKENKVIFDRIFEVLNSEDLNIGIEDAYYASSAIEEINPKAYSSKISKYYEKELILRYLSKKDLKELLFKFRLHPYCDYEIEIFEKVYDILDTTDISLLLNHLTSPNINNPKILHFLEEKGIDLTNVIKEFSLREYYIYSGIDPRYSNRTNYSDETINKPKQEDIEKILNKYFELKKSFSKNDTQFYRYSIMNLLDKNSSIYYSLMTGEKNIGFTNLNEFISYLKEYGEKTFTLEEKLNESLYKDLIHSTINFSTYQKANYLLSEISILPDEVLSKEHKNALINELNQYIKKEEDYKLKEEKRKKYKSIPDENLLDTLLSTTDEEELKFIISDYEIRPYFNAILQKLPREKIIELSKYSNSPLQLLMMNENVSYEYLLTMLQNKQLNNCYISELFETHNFNGKINETDTEVLRDIKVRLPLKDIVDSYNFTSREEFGSVFLYYPTIDKKSRFKLNFSYKVDYPKQDNELDDLAALVKSVKLYENFHFDNSSDENFTIRLDVDIKNLITTLNTYPEFVKFVDWNNFKDEITNYVDELSKYPEFCYFFIRNSASNDELKDQRKLCEINLLKESIHQEKIDSRYLEAYLYNEKTIQETFNLVLENNFTREEILKLLSNSNISRSLIYGLTEKNKFNSEEIYSFIEKIDSNGRLLKFYKSISNNYMEKLISSGIIKPYTKLEDVQRRFLDNIYTIEFYKDDIENILKNNPNLFYTMNYDLLKVMDPKNIEFLSKYEEVKNTSVDKLIHSGNHINNIINYLNKRLDHPEGEIFKIISLCANLRYQDEANKFWDTFSEEEAIYLASCKNGIFSSSFINSIDLKTISLMQHMLDEKKLKLNKVLENPDSSKEDLIDAYLNKFFSMTLDEAQEKVNIYGKDISNIINYYTNKVDLTDKEKMELYSLKHIEFLKEVIDISDTDTIRKLINDFTANKSQTTHNIVTNLMIEEHLKAAFNKEKNESLYVPKEEDKFKEVSIKGKKIPVYKPKYNFNMLITVVGAYVQNSTLGNKPKENWNNPLLNTSQDICTSLIGIDNLSMAINDNNLKFGFINIGESEIRSEAPYDLSSNASQININTLRQPEFRTTQNMKDNIRVGHSELLLDRSFEGKDGKTYKRQPDYIISINKITKQDKIAARDFGIPIVYIDTKEISKIESKKIESLKDKVITKDENGLKFNLDVLQDIITKYHNNYAGLITIDKKSIKKNLNPKQMEDYLLSLAKKVRDSKDEEAILRFNEILTHEEEKRKSVSKEFIPFEFTNIRKTLEIAERSTNTTTSNFDQYKVNVTSNIIQEAQSISEHLETYIDIDK